MAVSIGAKYEYLLHPLLPIPVLPGDVRAILPYAVSHYCRTESSLPMCVGRNRTQTKALVLT